MLYLLDTSALLAHFRQETGWQDVQALFEDDDAGVTVASVTFTEFGRRILDLGATASEVEDVLSSYQLLFTEILAVDTTVAKAALVLGFRTPGRLPLVDALIAAAAQTKSAVLVHRDEHMRSIPVELLRQYDLGATLVP